MKLSSKQKGSLRSLGIDPDGLSDEVLETFFGYTDRGVLPNWLKWVSGLFILQEPAKKGIYEEFMEVFSAHRFREVTEIMWAEDFRPSLLKETGTPIANYPLLFPQDFYGPIFPEVRNRAIAVYESVFDYIPTVWCPAAVWIQKRI